MTANAGSIPRAAVYPAEPVLSLEGQRLALKIWLIVTDAVALGAAFLFAYWLRFILQVTVAPEKRGVALVFQDNALFPHLNVQDNVGFGLSNLKPEARRSRVEALLLGVCSSADEGLMDSLMSLHPDRDAAG